jgi:hypothetical protein
VSDILRDQILLGLIERLEGASTALDPAVIFEATLDETREAANDAVVVLDEAAQFLIELRRLQHADGPPERRHAS